VKKIFFLTYNLFIKLPILKKLYLNLFIFNIINLLFFLCVTKFVQLFNVHLFLFHALFNFNFSKNILSIKIGNYGYSFL